jgi:hypothetical protein
MEFKVGDMVRITKNTNNHRFNIGDIVELTSNNGHDMYWLCRGDSGGYYVTESEFDLVEPQPEQTPPRTMHPDDFMLAVSEFAADNGFGVTQLEFHGTEFVGSALPRHSYAV